MCVSVYEFTTIKEFSKLFSAPCLTPFLHTSAIEHCTLWCACGYLSTTRGRWMKYLLFPKVRIERRVWNPVFLSLIWNWELMCWVSWDHPFVPVTVGNYVFLWFYKTLPAVTTSKPLLVQVLWTPPVSMLEIPSGITETLSFLSFYARFIILFWHFR